MIYTSPPTTSVDIYGRENVTIPEGYEVAEFRQPRPGELILTTIQTYRNPPLPTPAGSNIVGPRFILRRKPIPTPTDIVRVVRVLEYIGPKDWVDKTLSYNAVGFEGKSIRQLSMFREEVKNA